MPQSHVVMSGQMVPERDCMVFNSLRMNLWVIRSRRENHCCAVGGLPSREMGPKELPSTLSRGVLPLVRGQLAALGHGQSPGRYPGSAQAAPRVPHSARFVVHRPCGQPAVQGGAGGVRLRALTCRGAIRAYVSEHVTNVPNTYSIGAEAGVRGARGQRPADL